MEPSKVLFYFRQQCLYLHLWVACAEGFNGDIALIIGRFDEINDPFQIRINFFSFHKYLLLQLPINGVFDGSFDFFVGVADAITARI